MAKTTKKTAKKSAKKTVKKSTKKKVVRKKAVKKSTAPALLLPANSSEAKRGRVGRPSSGLSDGEKYQKAGSSDLERKNAQSASARELFGKLPPVADPSRRAAASQSLELFCQTYLPKIFKRPFSAMQRRIAEAIEDSIQNGGKQAIAVYRRGRKTSTSRAGLLWALLCKNVRYAIFLGATDKATQRTFEFYRDQIFCNDLLLADFPEVFFPLRETKGSANKSLLFQGERFRWKISSEEILFPMIPGFLLSGKKLDFRSIKSGSIRGSDHTIFGETVRPSLVLADDVMSDESAQSDIMNDEMYDKFLSTIEFLSGYDDDGDIEPLPVLVFGTTIQPNDALSRLLDRSQTPDYRGVIYRRVLSFPEREDLWKQYADLRMKSLDQLGNISLATAFYGMNMAEMDKGCVVTDPDDKEKGMLSAIQYAMDTRCRNPRKFWCEQQNDPQQAVEAAGSALTPKAVLRKIIDLPRYHIPSDAVAMTAHIDCGKHLLWFGVTAWGPSARYGHVCDYGSWPEQSTQYYRKQTRPLSLQDYYDTGDEYEKLRQAIVDCISMIFEQPYFDASGNDFDVHRLTNLTHFDTGKPLSFLSVVGVDSQDMTERESSVWNAVSASKYRHSVMPMYGSAASKRLLRYLPLKAGEKRRNGTDWIVNPESRRWAQGPQHGITSLKYDSNIYKSITNSALMLPPDAAGTITVFNGTAEDHEMLSMQLCSETATASRVGTDDYERWRMKSPQVADNDLWDVFVANSALRSFVDIESTAAIVPQQAPPKKVRLSELQKQKQQNMNQNDRRKRFGR